MLIYILTHEVSTETYFSSQILGAYDSYDKAMFNIPATHIQHPDCPTAYCLPTNTDRIYNTYNIVERTVNEDIDEEERI